MNPADNSQGAAPAAAQEPMIPKHRLDEVSARLREAEERERRALELLNRVAPQPTRQPDPVMTPEEFGDVDEKTAKVIMKVADRIAGQKMKAFEQQASQIIGNLANDVEATKFIAKRGGKAEPYLDKIRERQRQYTTQTGGFMDMETAYKLVRFDELESGAGNAPAPAPAQAHAPAPAAAAPAPAAPGSAGTQMPVGPSAAPAAATPTIEELEARIDAAIAGGSASF